ncbi:MAG: hypothetical protein IJ735_07745 [Clostridia bacterium]|nr:hypothetical protein [Clostridia bacterium]
MKTKLGILFIILGVLGIAAVVTLSVLGIIDPSALWFDYAVGGCALLIFVPLNFLTRKKSDYDDTIKNVRQARSALSKIKADEESGIVKLSSARNQIYEAEICMQEVVDGKELYELRPLLNALSEAKDHYKEDDNFQAKITEATLQADLHLLDDVESAMIKLRSQNA